MVVPEDLHQKKQMTARVQVYLFGSLALLVAGFLIYDYFNIREQRLAQAELVFGILSPPAMKALADNNPGLANGEFKRLAEIPSLLSAVLYNEDSTPVAGYFHTDSHKSAPEPSAIKGFRINGHVLEVMRPLIRDGRTLGTLYLQLSFENQQNTWRALVFLLLMFVFLAGWAWKSLLKFLSFQPEERAAKAPSIHPEVRISTEPVVEKKYLTETSGEENPVLNERRKSAGVSETRQWIEYTQITERMNFEIKMRKRAEDILKTYNSILELLTLGHPLNEILDQIIKNLERQIGPGVRGVIYRMDEGRGTLELASAPGLPQDYRNEIQVFDLKQGECVFVSTARDNRVIIVENFEDDTKWLTCAQRALQYGIRACWSVPAADPSGKVIGVVGVVSRTPGSPGVEELKHIRSAGFIAGMAITRNLYEEMMKSQANELERSNRDLEEFASIASHDLQEPLRKIVSFGEQLKKYYANKLDEKGNEYLEKMVRGTLRMQQFIGDHLAYSRAGEGVGPMEPTDLNQVVQEVLQDFEFQIEEKQARVTVRKLPVVPADPVQMRQVFSNLLCNSLKFSREGVTPEIEIESRSLNESQTEIIFRDNGIGFDETFRERIFKPFERLNPANQYEGTGIGLALCKKIMERHGGGIRAESQPGHGTTLHLTLPTG